MAYYFNPGFENDSTLIGRGWYDQSGQQFADPYNLGAGYTDQQAWNSMYQDIWNSVQGSTPTEKYENAAKIAGGHNMELGGWAVQNGLISPQELQSSPTYQYTLQFAGPDNGPALTSFMHNYGLPLGMAAMLGGAGYAGLGAMGALGGAEATGAEAVAPYGGFDAGAVAGGDYSGLAGVAGGGGGVTVNPAFNAATAAQQVGVGDWPYAGEAVTAEDLASAGDFTGGSPYDAGPYGGFDPGANYGAATAAGVAGAAPIISNYGGQPDNFGLHPNSNMSGAGSPLGSVLGGTDWLGLGGDILGYAGQREYQKDLMNALNRAIDYSDPAYAQRPQYQQQYANMQNDPTWMNRGFLGNIQNEALRSTAAQNAAQGYVGSGNILHDLTRTAAETTSKYALPYMEQIGQAGGLLGGRQNASQAISSLGEAAGQAGLGQNYALGSMLGRLPRQGVNQGINTGINSILSGLGTL